MSGTEEAKKSDTIASVAAAPPATDETTQQKKEDVAPAAKADTPPVKTDAKQEETKKSEGAADAASAAQPSAEDAKKSEASGASQEEEEEELTTGPWKLPNVQVQLSNTGTGEEDEECLWTRRSKLYRWRDSAWKERGLGDSKLLKDKTSGKIRFLLRQEKTGKIVANHYVLPRDKMCTLTPNAGSDTIYVWSALDCSEEEPRPEQFALKFGQAEAAQKFKEEFTGAGKANLELYDAGKFN